MYIILVTIANWTYAKEDFYEIIKFMPIQEILFTFDSNAFNAIQCNSCISSRVIYWWKSRSGSNDTVDRNALIEEVISEVKDNQAQPIATRASGSLIGEKDYTYTREPKGKSWG